MNMTKEDYARLAASRMKKSPILKDTIIAFIVGGLVCVLGQGLTDLYKNFGAATETARLWSTLSLVFLAGLLTALGLYDDIAKFAGAGVVVPITGFANSVVSPAMEFKSEGLVLGLGAKMFIVAGPVLAYGISASVIYGLIYALLR